MALIVLHHRHFLLAIQAGTDLPKYGFLGIVQEVENP